MKQLGQAARPEELQDLAAIGVMKYELRMDASGMDEADRAAMDRHYELLALPGICEAIARRDWDAIDRIAEQWDYT